MSRWKLTTGLSKAAGRTWAGRALIYGSVLTVLLPGAGGRLSAAEPLDEHMILVMPIAIVTFDASTVKIKDGTRIVRTHVYLPAPDEDGHVSYQSLEEIDCVGKRHRYTNATAIRPDGRVDPVTAEKEGFDPIAGESITSVLRDYVCAIEDKPGYPVGGVMLEPPGAISAHAAFALLKVGLTSEQAANLSSRSYGDQDALTYNLDRQKIEQAKRSQVIEALGSLVADGAKPPPPTIPVEAAVKSGRVGQYVHSEMELGAGMWLKADGTFEYGLTVGSLDETARGNWLAAGDRITLSPGPMRVKRGDIDFSRWQVISDGESLTIIRDGHRMRFGKRTR